MDAAGYNSVADEGMAVDMHAKTSAAIPSGNSGRAMGEPSGLSGHVDPLPSGLSGREVPRVAAASASGSSFFDQIAAHNTMVIMAPCCLLASTLTAGQFLVAVQLHCASRPGL
jgi:hypothetical protein